MAFLLPAGTGTGCSLGTVLQSLLPRFHPSAEATRIVKGRVNPCFPICLTTRSLLNRSHSNSMRQPSCDGQALAAVQTPSPSENDTGVLVQYIVLRRDLIDRWPLGSVVTQGCHASVAAIWAHNDDPHTIQYCSPQNIDSMHKVTLEVKGETQMLNLSEKLTAVGIAHKLWIEQPENIPTCLATKPYPKSIVSVFFKKLKLCK